MSPVAKLLLNQAEPKPKIIGMRNKERKMDSRKSFPFPGREKKNQRHQEDK